MPERTKHDHGMFSWVDLMTTDQDAAKEFYPSLFGWDVKDRPMPQGGAYSMFMLNGKAVAAASTLPQEHAEHGVPPMWNSYVTVDDVDQVAKSVEAAGGKVLSEPFDVMTEGRMAVVSDPTGGTLCLWQARDHIGAEVVAEDNAFSWNELYTDDVEAAKRFYSELLGWTYEGMDTPNGTYWLIKNGDDMNGGIMQKPSENIPSIWAVYFTVSDVDSTVSKATDNGGSVVMPAMDIPNVGRIAWISDPQSATFAVMTPANPGS